MVPNRIVENHMQAMMNEREVTASVVVRRRHAIVSHTRKRPAKWREKGSVAYSRDEGYSIDPNQKAYVPQRGLTRHISASRPAAAYMRTIYQFSGPSRPRIIGGYHRTYDSAWHCW